MGRIVALDGMRGILALAVAVYHLTGKAIFPGAYAAVDMFFIMSGYVLCHAYSSKIDSYTFSTFFWRRFSRLYPVYIVTVLVMLPMAYIGFPLEAEYLAQQPNTFSQGALVAYLGAFQMFVPGQYWNTPGWSVSGEIWLSLGVFAALPWVARRNGSAWLPILGAISIYAAIVTSNGSLSIISREVGGIFSGAALRPACGFLMGVGLYKLIHSGRAFKVDNVLLHASELILLALCLIVPIFIGRTVFDFGAVVAFSLLVALMVHEDDRSWTTRILSWKPMLYLGAISYSIYLWHTPIKHFFFRYSRDNGTDIGVEGVLVYIVLVIFVSHVSFKFIERPAQGWLNRRIGLTKKISTNPKCVGP